MSNKLFSVDETISYLKLHDNDKIKDMVTVSTKTFYNYIHEGKVAIKLVLCQDFGQFKYKNLVCLV